MATYAAYRHIELDKVGFSKKRVRNPPSDIFNVLCTPQQQKTHVLNGNSTPRRSTHDNSFNRLFGSPEQHFTPRRSSIPRSDVTTRNPVTGDGVVSWDCRPDKKSPRASVEKQIKVVKQRNPVTGEVYTIVSPSSTPTKLTNGCLTNGTSTPNGNIASNESIPILTNGIVSNGQA